MLHVNIRLTKGAISTADGVLRPRWSTGRMNRLNRTVTLVKWEGGIFGIPLVESVTSFRRDEESVLSSSQCVSSTWEVHLFGS